MKENKDQILLDADALNKLNETEYKKLLAITTGLTALYPLLTWEAIAEVTNQFLLELKQANETRK